MPDFESRIKVPTPLVRIHEELFEEKGVEVYVKRDDLTHEFISGNKFRKLKYNLIEAEKRGYKKLLTFGGAFSNHLSAFAFACHTFGFEGKAIVRGEELKFNSSPTLTFLSKMGIEMEFVSREEYRNKSVITEKYQEGYYIIPEGGSNRLAIKGVAELVAEIGDFDYIVTACGTGGTAAGLIKGGLTNTQVLAVSVLKNGSFLNNEIAELLGTPFPANAELFTNYHFGGYAKYTEFLLHFIREFEQRHKIRLEQIYTGKAFFAFYDLLKKDYFPRNSKVILLHTGGLQGRHIDL